MSRNQKKAMTAGFKRLFNSKQGKKVFPRAMKDELQFEAFLPFVSLQADDKSVLTRGGELIQCIRVDGLNSMTSSDREITLLKEAIAELLAQQGERYAVYVHKISRPFKVSLTGIETDGFAKEVDTAWAEVVAGRKLRDKTLTISIINRPAGLFGSLSAGDKLKEIFSRSRKKDALQSFIANKAERLNELDETVGVVLATLGHLNARVLTGASGELVGFLEGIGTGIELPAFPSNDMGVLARSICNYRTTFRGTRVHVTGGVVSNRVGHVFTIKNYPTGTFPGMFDELNLPIDMVITNSFVPISDDKASELIRRNLEQRRGSGDAAETDQQMLREGRNKVSSGLETLGYHHMTVAIYAEDEKILARAAADVRQIAQETGTKIITEAFAGQGHYFAQWPGNATYRARTGLVSNQVFAGMAALHRTPTGLTGDLLPWRTPMTVFPTPEKSGFLFSFHPAGEADKEPPAGHTVIFGPSSGGKSVLISFLMTQAQRVGARIFAFDYLRGLEVQIEALGGSYTTISPHKPTGLNPLYAETDMAGQAWLSEWLTALLNRTDRPLSPVQTQQLHDAVVETAKAPNHLRNFNGFPSLFRHLDDSGDLEQRVREWGPGGRYGWVFGGNETDNFALDQNVMGFDMTAVLDSDNEKERTAILGYIFQRLERKLQDRRPTIIVIDEAWNALGTEYFADKLEKWLVTARKLNAVVVMVTQFPSQLEKSKAGAAILQGVQTQILIPNRAASADNYAALQLNDREMGMVLGAPTGSRLALIRNASASVVVDVNLGALGESLKILGGSKTGRAALDDYRQRADKKEVNA
ncbi:VirB4 family type IV secretion/conjugal transfer ATPase [Paracoccus beibuensis]|uniref:VirB4 family type IV secretion/conjugal transfer ATPase n=1 Tax=Paracoccus beibuensis TaxID=547602 RepID=UPI0022403E95|nr:type IV secretion system protein B4 [Paracoccus beibuensis]